VSTLACAARICRAPSPNACPQTGQNQLLATGIGQPAGLESGQRHIDRTGNVPFGKFVHLANINDHGPIRANHIGQFLCVDFPMFCRFSKAKDHDLFSRATPYGGTIKT
jgi:hypothetical protein